MKTTLFLSIIILLAQIVMSQSQIITSIEQIENLPKEIKEKNLSGLLIKSVIEKNNDFREGKIAKDALGIKVFLYYSSFPSEEEFAKLDNLGIYYYLDTWIPPLKNHPYGFIIATMPADKYIQTMSLNEVKKISFGEYEHYPTNNNGVVQMNADKIWLQGYTGAGVKIAVLDSGLDNFYDGTDIPAAYQKKDYSAFPTLDDDVQNTVSAHGTHVTGSVLGRGQLSQNYNSNNGTGAFKGSAPGADLVFLKIGSDATSSASGDAMVAAIQAAVTIYNVDVLSMSYGGWYDHHDGSSSTEQTLDWAVAQGVTCFLSAGNEGGAKRHFSGTVAGSNSTDFIPVTITSSRAPVFNLVWSDGAARKNLILRYYDGSQNLINTITYYSTSESPRGTESQYSQAQSSFGAGTYYLKVENPSAESQFFHIYEYYGGGVVTFQNPDPYYTVGQPSTADNVISVGAYVSRFGWYDYNNIGPYNFTGQNSQYQIANFSSRGPRVDGTQKPEIVAPGSAIISLRDMDVITSLNPYCVDNDGTVGGDVNYYVMQGTSMACPLAAGTGALYLQKNSSATPQNVKEALINNTSKSVTEVYPNYTWGYGKLDIYAAMNSTPAIDGYMSDPQYSNLAYFSSGQNGFGDDNTLKSLKYYADGTDIYLGITGEITNNDNVLVLFDFSDYNGRGSNTLGNGGTDAGVFKYIGGAKMDFDVDFGLAFNEGISTTNFYIDACRYGSTPAVISTGYLGNIGSQLGLSSSFNLGAVFGGSGNITAAYHNGFDSDSLRGVEMKIPISAFSGVTNAHTVRIFVIIVAGGNGYFSNECIPGNPGVANPGNDPAPDFSILAGGPFHTGISPLPVELVAFTAKATGMSVSLFWQTNTEVNNHGFEIERTTGIGSLWEKVGFIPGAGNSNSPKEYSFIDNLDNEQAINLNLKYRLRQIDLDGTSTLSEEINVALELPQEYALNQNFPNPFNPETVIRYQLPVDSKVTLNLYDVLGKEVATLVDKEQTAGYYNYKLSISDYQLTSGVYIYRIVAGDFVSVKKMVVLK